MLSVAKAEEQNSCPFPLAQRPNIPPETNSLLEFIKIPSINGQTAAFSPRVAQES